MNYLNTCTAMLLNEDHIRMCIQISQDSLENKSGLGLHQCLMEFQRQVMENNFAVSFY